MAIFIVCDITGKKHKVKAEKHYTSETQYEFYSDGVMVAQFERKNVVYIALKGVVG